MLFQDNVFDEMEGYQSSSGNGCDYHHIETTLSLASPTEASRTLTSRSTSSALLRTMRLNIPETSRSDNVSHYSREQNTTSRTTSDENELRMDAAVLQRKLQSKTEALHILRQQLEQFRSERDQFKLMAETLQLRYHGCRRYNYNDVRFSNEKCDPDSKQGGGGGSMMRNNNMVSNILHDTREQNIRLTMEIELLKQKIFELKGDLDVLRLQRPYTKTEDGSSSLQSRSSEGSGSESGSNSTDHQSFDNWKKERSHLISQLEHLKQKCVHLSFDLGTIIDEKEELIMERDAYKYKVHRVNHELLRSLKANKVHPKFLDIDSVITENDYLQERLNSVQNQLDTMNQKLEKCNALLDAKRKKGIVKLSTMKSNDEQSVFLQKQINDLIRNNVELPDTVLQTIEDLKSTCLILLDKLNDQDVAISHQKQTNKSLAWKNAQLEQRLYNISENGSEQHSTTSEQQDVSINIPEIKHFSPAKYLLEGYNPVLLQEEEQKNEDEKMVDFNAKNTASKSPRIYVSEQNPMNAIVRKSLHADESDNDEEESLSSFTSESERSIISSEYENAEIMSRASVANVANVSKCLNFEPTPRSTNSTSAESGSETSRLLSQQTNSSYVLSDRIARERKAFLKNLPEDLASLVWKSLEELDAQDLDLKSLSSTNEFSTQDTTEPLVSASSSSNPAVY